MTSIASSVKQSLGFNNGISLLLLQFGQALTVQLYYVPPFSASSSSLESGQRAGWVLIDSQPVWEEVLADLPWSDKTR
jgi:hypothetical protein